MSVCRVQLSLPHRLVADLTSQNAAEAGSYVHGWAADAETGPGPSRDTFTQTVVSICLIQREALALIGTTGFEHSSPCTSKGKKTGCEPDQAVMTYSYS